MCWNATPRTTAMLWATSLALAALGLAPIAAQPLGRLAAIGDSLCDEYGEQGYGDYARNWVELLVEQRGVDFGPTAAAANQPGNTWGEPVRTRFQDNWARYGADTTSALASGQHLGVVTGALEREVSHVVVFIGNNNFGPGIGNTNAYNAIYNDVWSDQEVADHIEQGLGELELVLDPIVAAGVRVVVAGAFDFGATPSVRLLFPNVAKRDRVSAAIAAFGNGVRTIAAQRGLIFLDTYSAGRAIFGTNATPRSTLSVGNVPIQLGQIAFGSGTTAAFVGDGVHPHTVIQGLVANLVLTALGLDPKVTIEPFTEAELLAHNGLSYGGADTLQGQIGPLLEFVENFGLPFADGFESGDTSGWSGVTP